MPDTNSDEMTEAAKEPGFDLNMIRLQASGSPNFMRQALFQAADRLQELNERVRGIEALTRSGQREKQREGTANSGSTEKVGRPNLLDTSWHNRDWNEDIDLRKWAESERLYALHLERRVAYAEAANGLCGQRIAALEAQLAEAKATIEGCRASRSGENFNRAVAAESRIAALSEELERAKAAPFTLSHDITSGIARMTQANLVEARERISKLESERGGWCDEILKLTSQLAAAEAKRRDAEGERDRAIAALGEGVGIALQAEKCEDRLPVVQAIRHVRRLLEQLHEAAKGKVGG